MWTVVYEIKPYADAQAIVARAPRRHRFDSVAMMFGCVKHADAKFMLDVANR